MDLKPGDTLGPYEIIAEIGRGGMGEVWKARDPRLNRDVAIKTSHQHFTDRFLREARAVAALNHPNICTLYDVGTDYLVMEYIEGAAPSAPLPIETLLDYARQIAAGLDAAHEKGVVHRDLKPANLRVTPDGVVKILDFGLARMGPEKANPDIDPSSLPTIVSPVETQAGIILGTASYMSPEQARGNPVDKRTDIWAFGVVLYELSTGDRLFAGETISDTIAKVLIESPDIAKAPDRLKQVIRWCLEKDPKKRLRDIADALPLLSENTFSPPMLPRSNPWLWRGLAAGALLCAAGFGAFSLQTKPVPAPQPIQIALNLPDKVSFTVSGSFSISPDGRRLAYSASGLGGPQIFVQDLSGGPARVVPDSTTGPETPPFFWSPDSRYLVFSGPLLMTRKADLQTWNTVDLFAKQHGPVVGGDWSKDGVIVFGSTRNGLWRVPSTGGEAQVFSALRANGHEIQHELPQFLPDGQHVLYFVNATDPAERGVYVRSLQAPPAAVGKKIINTDFGARLLPEKDGLPSRLLYLQNNLLFSQEMDLRSLTLTGKPMALPIRVGTVYQTAYFAATNSVMVYRQTDSSALKQMVWQDLETGKQGESVGEPGPIAQPAISPDQTKIAYTRNLPGSTDADIWVLDLARGSSTRITFGNAFSSHAVWTPDSSELLFASQAPGAKTKIYRKKVNGTGEQTLILQADMHIRPHDLSTDGKYLLYSSSPTASFNVEQLWVAPLQGGAGTPLTNPRFDAAPGHFSPDGRWITYASIESGRSEIYVRKVLSNAPLEEEKMVISRDGGVAPAWRRDGRAIYWTRGNEILMAEVDTSKGFRVGLPKSVSVGPVSFGGVFSPDMKRAILIRPANESKNAVEQPYFNVMLNWMSALRQP